MITIASYFVGILVFLSLLGIVRLPDTWFPPGKVTVPSSDRTFAFTVHPPKNRSWQAAHDSTGSDFCHGTLHHLKSSSVIWSRALANRIAPVDVAVSRQGRVVTLDDWYGLGYGPNVVVVYDEKGEIVKRYKLSDLATDKMLGDVIVSISSIWWRSSFWFEKGDSVLAVQIASKKNTGDTIRVSLW